MEASPDMGNASLQQQANNPSLGSVMASLDFRMDDPDDYAEAEAPPEAEAEAQELIAEEVPGSPEADVVETTVLPQSEEKLPPSNGGTEPSDGQNGEPNGKSSPSTPIKLPKPLPQRRSSPRKSPKNGKAVAKGAPKSPTKGTTTKSSNKKRTRVSLTTCRKVAQDMLQKLIENSEAGNDDIALPDLAKQIKGPSGKPYTNHRSDAIAESFKLLRQHQRAELVKGGKARLVSKEPLDFDEIPPPPATAPEKKAKGAKTKKVVERKRKKRSTGKHHGETNSAGTIEPKNHKTKASTKASTTKSPQLPAKRRRSSAGISGLQGGCHSIPFTLPKRLFGAKMGPRKKGPGSSLLLQVVDCHAGGEPARVVLGGLPRLPSGCATALQKRNYMMEHMDHIRKVLLLEPRGYPCQNANFVFAPTAATKDNDETTTSPLPLYQYVIAEQNRIYPLMSGHNTLCVATALLECGIVPMAEPVTEFALESPAGAVAVTAACAGGRATSVALSCPPSFAEHLGVVVKLPEVAAKVLGVSEATVDVAYGGMWYCIVDLHQFRRTLPDDGADFFRTYDLDPTKARSLCRLGEVIKVACREQFPVQHPTHENYAGPDILAFRDSLGGTARNAVVMSNTVLDWDRPETWTGMIDRSPCGTGTAAIMATLYARNELAIGQPLDHHSLVGSSFVGTILGTTTLPGGRTAVLPRLEGAAWITQAAQVVVDEEDPFPEGLAVGDIW